MRTFAFVISIVFLSFISWGQEKSNQYSLMDDLMFYGDAMINGVEASTRVRAANNFEKLFETYLSENKNVEAGLAVKKFISILPAPNDEFTLISWMIKGPESIAEYKGYLLIDNQVIKLKRNSKLNAETASSTSTTEDWYGCLYYHIMEHEKNSYLLFGLDGDGKYDNQKLVDVLTIDDKKVSFGAPIFEDPENLETYLNRLIISYSADAAVSLNYHEGLGVIMHDHMQARMGKLPGQGPTNIPDGTYEGYEKVNNKWHYIEKMYSHTYEEDNPPRPQPVFHDKPEDKKDKRKKR